MLCDDGRVGGVARGSEPDTARGRSWSTSLLDTITAEGLDPAYRVAADRRSVGGRSGHRRSGAAAGAALAVIGLLFATAAAQVRASAPAEARTRAALVDRIERRTAETDALQSRVAGLRAEGAQARDQVLALTAMGAQAAENLQRLEQAAAVTPVEGPGVTVTVDDAPADEQPLGTEPATPPAPELSRILDVDLQKIVNALWAAGAEAVAVDGQRLSALTAIRSAGEAILVDYRPISPPYTVSAVGDPALLEPRFVDGPAGRELRTLAGVYGIRYDVTPVERIRLPGASGVTLRFARVVGAGS